MRQCYECESKSYDFLITSDNVPSTFNCTTIDTLNKFFLLDIWTIDNGTKSDLRVNTTDNPENKNVPYVLIGFINIIVEIILVRFFYHCLTDNCNNPQLVLQRLIESTKTEIKPLRRSTIGQAQSSASIDCFAYSNFTNSIECKPVRQTTEKEDCSFCAKFINTDPSDLLTERVCSYCEKCPQAVEYWKYIDGRIH